MINYKGIFYNDEKEKKYYEFGAHFKYKELVFELNELIKEKETTNSSKQSKENILIFVDNKNIFRVGKKSKSLLKRQKEMNLNFLTINSNTNPRRNRFIINKSSKIKSNIEKNKGKEFQGINSLLHFDLKNTKKSNVKTNSLEKNINIKTLGNFIHNKDINKTISIYLNHNKIPKKNNLPFIKNYHYKNFSNKNIFKSNQINIDKKNETSKYNIFFNNKEISPFKTFRRNRANANIFSIDFSESKKNKNSLNTLNTVTFNKNKLYLKNEYYNIRTNINIVNIIKNKKSKI